MKRTAAAGPPSNSKARPGGAPLTGARRSPRHPGVLFLCALAALLAARALEVGAAGGVGGPGAPGQAVRLRGGAAGGSGAGGDGAGSLRDPAEAGGGGSGGTGVLALAADEQDKSASSSIELSDEALEQQLQHDAATLGDAQSLCDYADFLQTAGRELALARKLYTRALQLEPASVRTHCSFGRLLHGCDQLDAAERHYNAALLLNPMDVDTLSCSAVLAQARVDLERAAAFYEQVLAVEPSSAHTHSNYATLLLEIEHAARRGSPQYARDANTQGTSAYQERAEWHLRQAMELNPRDTHALYNYAVVQQELHGNALDAAQALLKVLQLKPTDPDASYNLAVTQQALADLVVDQGIRLLQGQGAAEMGETPQGTPPKEMRAELSERAGTIAEASKASQLESKVSQLAAEESKASQLAAEWSRVKTALALFQRAEEVAPGLRVQLQGSGTGTPRQREMENEGRQQGDSAASRDHASSGAAPPQGMPLKDMPLKELIEEMRALLPQAALEPSHKREEVGNRGGQVGCNGGLGAGEEVPVPFLLAQV